ncbi:MAG: universal stress protein, partial [bacterium]
MDIVVGVSADDSGEDAVALGAVLARLLEAHVVLVYVHPPTMDYPSMGRVDAEWATFLAQRADEALSEARHQLARDWSVDDVEALVVPHVSVGRALRHVAEEREAAIIVLGPSTRSNPGQISLGPISQSLLHGAGSAVALAPEGYREMAPDTIERIVVGFQDTPESAEAVEACWAVAHPRDLPLHLLTIVLRVSRLIGARVGRDPERMVMESLVERERSAQERFIATRPGEITGSVVTGDSAASAMSRFDWQDSDVFV